MEMYIAEGSEPLSLMFPVTPAASAIESFLARMFLCNFCCCPPEWNSAELSPGF